MLIIVADMHIGGTPEEAQKLSGFLARLSESPYDICFAGDILDLWIGEQKFDSPIQNFFIEWCRKEKSRRRIYFIEGNHEFFVCRRYKDCFTEADTEQLRIGNILVIHGDNLPGQNLPHRFFRWLTKGAVCRFLLRFMPQSQKIVARIKKRFEQRSIYRKSILPMKAIQEWEKNKTGKDNSLRTMVFGHFHLEYLEQDSANRILCGLPAWKDNQKIAVADPESGKIDFRENW